MKDFVFARNEKYRAIAKPCLVFGMLHRFLHFRTNATCQSPTRVKREKPPIHIRQNIKLIKKLLSPLVVFFDLHVVAFKKNIPFALFLLIFFLTSGLSAEQCKEKNSFYPYGLPQTNKQITCLNQTSFSIGYSEKYKNSLWVSYRVRSSPLYKNYQRFRYFSADERTQSKVAHYQYSRSGYTRGHMAPAATIYYGFGNKEMEQTFLMSNIVPQAEHINGGIWATIENLEREFARKNNRELIVIAGPIFDQHRDSLVQCSKRSEKCTDTGIEIPDQFYKIILFYDKKIKEYRTVAFLIDHRTKERNIQKFLVSIDKIEALTQINFLPYLQEHLEEKLEAHVNKRSFDVFVNSQ